MTILEYIQAHPNTTSGEIARGMNINFMVNQLGLTHQEAKAVYDRLACED